MDDGSDNDGLRTRPDKMRRRHVPVIVWLALGSLLVSGCVPQLLGTKKEGDADLRKGISAPENNKTAVLGGENPDEVEAVPVEEQARSFSHKPAWARFLIVLAGPGFPLVFTLRVLWAIIWA
ncbi:MAG: hypothetical protein V2B18_21770, partial [Pseudomonadota bacterium]